MRIHKTCHGHTLQKLWAEYENDSDDITLDFNALDTVGYLHGFIYRDKINAL